ncbi:MAG: hypothetical protein IPG56_07310 [Caulobacteraceae bacterium]|nr:hypothetical protein [Caulobacteraceae bacterium]
MMIAAAVVALATAGLEDLPVFPHVFDALGVSAICIAWSDRLIVRRRHQ